MPETAFYHPANRLPIRICGVPVADFGPWHSQPWSNFYISVWHSGNRKLLPSRC